MRSTLSPEVVEARVCEDHAAVEFLIRVTTALTTRTYVSAGEFDEVLDLDRQHVGRIMGELRLSDRSALECVDETTSRNPKYRFAVERGGAPA